jgi:hypothetical protein
MVDGHSDAERHERRHGARQRAGSPPAGVVAHPPTPTIEGEEARGTRWQGQPEFRSSGAREDEDDAPEMPTCVSPEHVHACSHGASLKGNHAKSSEARSRHTDADRQATCSCCSHLGPAYKFSHTPCRARRTGVARTTANQRGSNHGEQVQSRPRRSAGARIGKLWYGSSRWSGAAQQPGVQVHGHQIGLPYSGSTLCRRTGSSVQRADWCAARHRCPKHGVQVRRIGACSSAPRGRTGATQL